MIERVETFESDLALLACLGYDIRHHHPTRRGVQPEDSHTPHTATVLIMKVGRSFPFVLLSFAAASLLLTRQVESFSVTAPNNALRRDLLTTTLNAAACKSEEISGRRAFLGTASAVLVGGAVSVAAATATATPAWAAVDDLAMPTPEEQKKMEDVRIIHTYYE